MSVLNEKQKKLLIDNVDFNGLTLWISAIELANKEMVELSLDNKPLQIILDRQFSAIKGLKLSIIASKPIMKN